MERVENDAGLRKMAGKQEMKEDGARMRLRRA